MNDIGGQVDGTGTDAGPAQTVVQEIEADGGEAVANTDSVATEAGAASIVNSALSAFGRIDIVINNAGILAPTLFPEMTVDDLTRHLDIHLNGAFFVTRAAWPHMLRQHYGRVLLTTSAAIYGGAPSIAYATAKAALIGLGRALAVTGGPEGITVNLIAPGAETRMSSIPGFHALAGAQHERVTRTATGKNEGPEAVAPAVVYLVHESCTENGQIILAGRGRVARMFIGETPGLVGAMSPEEISDGWETVIDRTSYIVPASAAEHVTHDEQLIRSASA